MTEGSESGLYPVYIPRDEESQILDAVRRVREAEREAAGPVTWLEPIDLDDPEYWLLTNLQANVARQLDPVDEYFQKYTEYLARPPRQNREHVTSEAVVSHLGHVRRIFLECYANYIQGTAKPVVMVFDTVEAIRGMSLVITLTREWMSSLPRTLFVLSGRPVPGGAQAGDFPAERRRAIRFTGNWSTRTTRCQ
jgi:hypothetical protein